MKQIVITGVTLTGNMGGVAMLKTTHTELRRMYPDVNFSLLSITPKQDRSAKPLAGMKIISSLPVILICFYLPLSFIMWPFWRQGIFRNIFKRIPYFAALLNAKVVVDLCGIAFVDGRGLPLLLYNVACCVPAIALGIPVAKLAQALGPFNKPLNKWAARQVLSRCSVVVGRGDKTGKYLSELQIENSRVLPDITFCLKVSPEQCQIAKAKLNNIRKNDLLVIISPSEVVRRLIKKSGESFEIELKLLLISLAKGNIDVVLLPHSFGIGDSKNNDVDMCKKLYFELKNIPNIHLIDDVREPILLRAIIGEADIFIGCRFHAVVSALSMAVPTMIIGWSHKYVEMSSMFGLNDWVIPVEKFNNKVGLEQWYKLLNEREIVKGEIKKSLLDVREKASENFKLVSTLISD